MPVRCPACLNSSLKETLFCGACGSIVRDGAYFESLRARHIRRGRWWARAAVITSALLLYSSLLARSQPTVLGLEFAGVLIVHVVTAAITLRMGFGAVNIYLTLLGTVHLTATVLLALCIAVPAMWLQFPRDQTAILYIGGVILSTYFINALPPQLPPPWICRKCQYPLRGLTQPRCPECGTGFNFDEVQRLVERLDRIERSGHQVSSPSR
jgi:hypothetical protein